MTATITQLVSFADPAQRELLANADWTFATGDSNTVHVSDPSMAGRPHATACGSINSATVHPTSSQERWPDNMCDACRDSADDRNAHIVAISPGMDPGVADVLVRNQSTEAHADD